MFQVEIFGRMKRAVRVEGRSQRVVAREFGQPRETVSTDKRPSVSNLPVPNRS